MGLVARGAWDLPGPGIEPVPSALAGRLSTTGPPGKSRMFGNFLLIFPHLLILNFSQFVHLNNT